MKKTRLPNGSKVNFETLIDNIQIDSYENLTYRTKLLFATGGVFFTKNGDFISSDLKLSVVNSGTGLSIEAGRALDITGNFYELEQTTWANVSTRPNNFYIVSLKYKELGFDPVQVQNGFVYNPLGSGEFYKKTRFKDSYDLIFTSYTGNINQISIPSGHVYLGLVKVFNNVFVTYDWSNEYPGEGVSTVQNGVFDLRELNRLTLNLDYLVSDRKILFIDKPYTGSQALTQDLQFNGNVILQGDLSASVNNQSKIIIKPTLSGLTINDPNTNIPYLKFDWDNSQDTGYETVTRVRTLYVDKLKVNNGTVDSPDWMDPALIGPTPSLPRNLRIYDMYPTEDPNEKKGYVEIKWNWDELKLAGTGSNFIQIEKITYTNESVDFTGLDLSVYLIGKKIYFPLTQNEYVITQVIDGSTYWQFNVEGNPSNETTDPGSGAIIVDNNIENYALRFTAANQQGKYKKETIYYLLDESYAYSPGFVQKLELGRQWNCTIQGINRNSFSSTVAMQPGTYDPDHSAGGQNPVSYGSPFLMKLPNINTTGDISLEATLSGFDLRINGWTGDNQNNAHEFEVIWSSTEALSEASFSDLTGCERTITKARKLHINSSQPTMYQVAVRPLQNKQGVGTPVIKTVVSGGGGIAPQIQVLFDDVVQIETYRFKVAYVYHPTGLTGSFYSDLLGGLEDINSLTLLGKYATIPVKTLFISDFNNNQHVTYTPSDSFDSGGVITPDYVSGSPPNPKTIDFTINNSSKNSDSILNDDSKWASVTSVNTTVAPNEKINFVSSAALFNWGKMRLKAKIHKASDNTVLAETLIIKDLEYPTWQPYVLSVGWTNDLGIATDVYVKIYFWANTSVAASYYTLSTNILASLFVDYFNQNVTLSETVFSGGTQDTKRSFGTAPIKALGTKTIVPENPVEYKISYYRRLWENYGILKLAVLDHTSIFSSGDELLIGATEKSRYLSEKNLSVDFEITSIEWWGYTAEGISSSKPGIIRVYPKGSPESAATLEVEGADQYFVDTGVKIKLNSLGQRAFVIDAWDPSDNPNNHGEFSGRLIIYGRPLIVNNFS